MSQKIPQCKFIVDNAGPQSSTTPKGILHCSNTTPLLISPCLFGPFFRPKLGLMNMVLLLRNDRYMSHCTKAVEQAHYALYALQTPDSKPCANFVLFAFHLCTRIWLRTLRLILSIKIYCLTDSNFKSWDKLRQ